MPKTDEKQGEGFSWEIKRCPVCGGGERLFESLAEEARAAGFAGPDWRFCWDSKEGVVGDPDRVKHLPTGTTVPTFGVVLDICISQVRDEDGSTHPCGNVYAIALKRSTFKVPPRTPPIIRPGLRMPPFGN